MSEKEKQETLRDDAIPLDKEIDREGLITESYEPSSKESYRHTHHRDFYDHSDSGHRHHSHHRSRHHRSHSHSRKKNKRERKSFKQFWQKNKKYLLYTVLAVVFFICAVFAGGYLDSIVGKVDTQESAGSTQITDGKLTVSVPVFDEEVSLVGSAVQAYLQADQETTVHQIFDQYKGNSYRLDVGAPVTLNYEIKSSPKDYAVKGAEFVVSEEADYSDPIVIAVDEKTTQAAFYNLKTGTRYYYRIDITFTNSVVSSVCGRFRTAIGPRLMTVDGVYNMRDVGGWTTTDGRMVRQGLLYRGCELDGAVADQYTITKAGIDTMLNDLGIKTDMDLRLDSENPHNIDVLGGNVEHIHYGTPMYAAIFNEGNNREVMRAVFSDLADKSQYPAYIHCTYGQDRTGTVCYLLGALLGVPQESLMQDYELSGLHHGYVANDEMSEFVERVNQLPGATLSDKVEGYLLAIGVTEQEIESIREIFLG